ncbi:MAG TPA: DUF1810 domain-containing protein [Acetobacteraceae bacterium]|nr:DUF1810 domain-containing protein [Acetobacteraceae bacterium]
MIASDAFPDDLGRFIAAQEPVIDRVRAELRAGRKSSHWMWFVFPQIAGLGRSETARFYAIRSLEEAAAYLAHPILGQRLVECTRLMNAVKALTAEQILGHVDALKFHSCMTLFAAVNAGQPDFSDALRRYFGGALDRGTLDLIRPDSAGT